MKEFVAGTIRDVIKLGGETNYISMLLGSWIRYMTGKDEKGATFEINDPEKDKFTALAQKVTADNNYDVSEIITETFGADIASNDKIKSEVSETLKLLYSVGSKETLKQMV